MADLFCSMHDTDRKNVVLPAYLDNSLETTIAGEPPSSQPRAVQRMALYLL